MSCTTKCDACPFNFFSEASMQASNYGCLPDPFDIRNMYVDEGLVWGCHDTSEADNNLKPCIGFINWSKERGEPLKIKGKPVVDYSQWAHDMGGSYMEKLKKYK